MSILLCFADEEHIKDKNLYVIMKSNKKNIQKLWFAFLLLLLYVILVV